MAESMPLLYVQPQGYQWVGPTTDGASTDPKTGAYLKIITHLTLMAPIQPGTATVTLVCDPGSTNTSTNVWVVDLTGAGTATTLNGVAVVNAASQPVDRTIQHITSLSTFNGGEVRAYIARLTIETSITTPIPQIWYAAAWGTFTAPLSNRT